MISGNSNKQSFSRVIGIISTLILTALFLYLAFLKVDFKNALAIISNTSLIEVLLYILIFYASHYARAIRWKYMLNSVKKDVRINHLFGSVMISYGVSCIIPRLGEVYRGLFLGKWEDIPRTTVLGTIVVERVIDIALFAFASLVSISIYDGDLFQQVSWLRASLIIGFSLVFCVIIILFLIVKFQEKFADGIVSITGKINKKASARIKTILTTLIDGFSSIKGFRSISAICFWSILIMVLYALNTYAGFYLINMHNNSQINFASAWIVMTLSSFGMLIPTPGGTGSYHMISIFVLTQVYNFDYDISAAYAILTHFISYMSFIFSTIGALFILNRQRTKRGLSKETFFTVLKSTEVK